MDYHSEYAVTNFIAALGEAFSLDEMKAALAGLVESEEYDAAQIRAIEETAAAFFESLGDYEGYLYTKEGVDNSNFELAEQEMGGKVLSYLVIDWDETLRQMRWDWPEFDFGPVALYTN